MSFAGVARARENDCIGGRSSGDRPGRRPSDPCV